MGLSAWIKGLPSLGRGPRPLARTPLAAVVNDAPQKDAATGDIDPAKLGVSLLQSGKLAAAADAFRKAVAQAPQSAANHVNLAYALQELGSGADAVVYLRQAIVLDPGSFDAHYMLGGALEGLGEHAAAAEHLRQAVVLKPEFEPARAELCRALVASGDTAEARAAIKEAIAFNPRHADFHHYLGNVCLSESHAEAAVASYLRALELQPNYAQVHGNLGIALHAQQQYDAAAASFERALEIDASLIDVHVKLAQTRKAQGRLEDAAQSLQRALDARPNDAEALNQMGTVLQEQGQLERATAYYLRAIELAPEQPGAYGNLGLALYEQGKVGEAVEAYRRGLAVRPLATTHDNLGIALIKQGAVDEAIEHYRAALALDPDNLNTRCNLGAALADVGGPRDAIAAYRHILTLKPDHLIAHSNLLFSLAYDDKSSVEDYLAEARRFDAKLTREPLEPRALPVVGGVPRPMRVGFVSGDLRGHPVGYFFEGIIDHLDRDRFELYAYSTSPTEDALTARIKPRFARWHLIKGRRAEDAANTIREDGVDVLIDLAGHSGLNALQVFAFRPAPVQVSWLGYFASTGVSAIDYVLADALCVPPGNERQFTEKVWRLPQTRLCYTPPQHEAAPAVAALPALQRGHVSFGCFQRLPKINDEVLALWGRVFAAVPTAHLVLQCPQMARPRFVEEMLRRLAEVGMAAERVSVRPPAHYAQYLSSYADVDIVLDTFPYTGGTTTCEALWMGVPTLTLAGETMLARQGVSMLGCAGLAEWVAETPADYVAKAVAFAGDIPRLAHLRSGLREQVRSSPLFDTRLFAHRLEAALVGMWQDKFGPPSEAA